MKALVGIVWLEGVRVVRMKEGDEILEEIRGELLILTLVLMFMASGE